MNFNKLQKVLFPLYILLLLSSFFYVRGVLKEGAVPVVEKPKKKQGFEVKPVEIFIIIKKFNTETTHNIELRNTKTVLDAFEKLRENKVLSYERTFYTNKVVFEAIDESSDTERYEWKVFLDDQDISTDMDNIKVLDKESYIVQLQQSTRIVKYQ